MLCQLEYRKYKVDEGLHSLQWIVPFKKSSIGGWKPCRLVWSILYCARCLQRSLQAHLVSPLFRPAGKYLLKNICSKTICSKTICSKILIKNSDQNRLLSDLMFFSAHLVVLSDMATTDFDFLTVFGLVGAFLGLAGVFLGLTRAFLGLPWPCPSRGVICPLIAGFPDQNFLNSHSPILHFCKVLKQYALYPASRSNI